jgi:hypothetical protein
LLNWGNDIPISQHRSSDISLKERLRKGEGQRVRLVIGP